MTKNEQSNNYLQRLIQMIFYEELLFNELKLIERLKRKEIIKSKLLYNILNDHVVYVRDYLIQNVQI